MNRDRRAVAKCTVDGDLVVKGGVALCRLAQPVGVVDQKGDEHQRFAFPVAAGVQKLLCQALPGLEEEPDPADQRAEGVI